VPHRAVKKITFAWRGGGREERGRKRKKRGREGSAVHGVYLPLFAEAVLAPMSLNKSQTETPQDGEGGG